MLVVVLWIIFPPFRIVKLDESGRMPQEGGHVQAFDPVAFVNDFWEQRLVAELRNATDLDTLLPLLVDDPLEARKSYGVHNARYYFAKGEGRVESVENRRATLKVGDARVSLLIAPPVFGNTVRDGTGLLSVNDFSGLEAFNAVSAVLNDKVEKEIMPPLATSVLVGRTVSFVACAKAPETVGDGALLSFVPLQVEVAQ